MEMTYDGAMVMPASFVVVDEEEMTYLDGGYVATLYGTAKYLKNWAAGLMSAWFTLASGYCVSAAVTAASVVGAGYGAVLGIGGAYCAFVGNEYRQAYNYFSSKSQSSQTQYYLSQTSFLAFVTGVSCGRA